MGQHKFNRTAIDAKAGKVPPKKRSLSKSELWQRLFDEHFREAVRKALLPGHPMLQPPKKIRTWEEMDGMTSWDGRYRIEVELDNGCGYIVPTFPVEDKDYWKHYEYLSTHAFYEKTHKMYTEILQRFGFNVELVSWG